MNAFCKPTLLVGLCYFAACCGCRDEMQSDVNSRLEVAPKAIESAQLLQEQRPSPDVGVVATISSRLSRSRQADHDRVLDPANDGWESESVSERAQSVIDGLVASAMEATVRSHGELERWLSPDFVFHSVRRSSESRVDRPPFSIERATELARSDKLEFGGPDGFVQAQRGLLGGATAADVSWMKTKTVGITSSDSNLRTDHRVEAVAEVDGTVREFSWQWHCEWESDKGSRVAKLRSLRTTQYQVVTASTPLYSDQSLHVFSSVDAYDVQLAKGLDYWLDRIEVAHGMYVFAEYGMALGDVNGDGFDDVYVCQPAGLPNRMFLRQADGRLVDHSRSSATDWFDHTSSALLVDVDNDGDQDLALALESKEVVVMQNDGNAKFRVATKIPIADRHVQGLSAADYDNDGRVDLYLTVGFADGDARSTEPRPAFAYHDANEGGRNVLLKNVSREGTCRFLDVTGEVGIDQNNRRHSLAAAWEDFDNDGDQDLYVANDYGPNCLYENRGGTFHDIAADAGVLDYGSGMSVSWSDYDHDGNVDLYVGNMYSSAGNRITRQASFQRQVSAEARSLLPRFAKGNTLLRNAGGGQFHDVGAEKGVEFGRWAWSSIFCDINNDGDDDLLIANGYITNDDKQDL